MYKLLVVAFFFCVVPIDFVQPLNCQQAFYTESVEIDNIVIFSNFSAELSKILFTYLTGREIDLKTLPCKNSKSSSCVRHEFDMKEASCNHIFGYNRCHSFEMEVNLLIMDEIVPGRFLEKELKLKQYIWYLSNVSRCLRIKIGLFKKEQKEKIKPNVILR